MVRVQITLELGHKAFSRTAKSNEGYTHDWCIFVRGPKGSNIRHFVEKVEFKLHDSFPKSRRVLKEPPYEVSEAGYAGFELPITVHFKNKEEPRKIQFVYDLFLHVDGCPPVNHIRCEKLTFQNPTEEFRRKLLKAGGIEVDSSNEAVSSPVVSYPTPDCTRQSPPSQPSPHKISPSSGKHQHNQNADNIQKAKKVKTDDIFKKSPKDSSKLLSTSHSGTSASKPPTAVVKPFHELFGPPITKPENKKSVSIPKEKLPKSITEPTEKTVKKHKSSTEKKSYSKSSKSSTGPSRLKRLAESSAITEPSKKHKPSETDKERKSMREKLPKAKKESKSKNDKVSMDKSKSSSHKVEKPEKYRKSKSTKEKVDTSLKLKVKGKSSHSANHNTESVTSKQVSVQSSSSNVVSDLVASSRSRPDHKIASKPAVMAAVTKATAVRAHLPPFEAEISTGEMSDEDQFGMESHHHFDVRMRSRSGSVSSNSSVSSLSSSTSCSSTSSLEEAMSNPKSVSPLPVVQKSPGINKIKDNTHRLSPKVKLVKDSKPPEPQKPRAKNKEKTQKNTNASSSLPRPKESKHEKKKTTYPAIPSVKPKVESQSMKPRNEQVSGSAQQKTIKLPGKDMNKHKAPNGEYLTELLDIQTRIMAMRDGTQLNKVATIIKDTGSYKISSSSFDFDLCSLNKETVVKLRHFLKEIGQNVK